LRGMTAPRNPTINAAPRRQPVQPILPFESPKPDERIPSDKQAECLTLLRELIDAVAGKQRGQTGGTHD